jgi:hypothetical protein
MDNGTNSRNSQEDDFLNELIRAARDSEEKGFIRPDDETISAYLLGSASEEQQIAIRKALIQSESFRREFLCLAQDIEKLENIDYSAEGKEFEKMKVPTLSEFLQSHAGPPPKPPGEPFRKFFRNFVRPRVLVPAAVATAVIALFVIWLSFRESRPSKQSFTIDQIQKQIQKRPPGTVQEQEPAPSPMLAMAKLNFVENMDPGYFSPNRTMGFPPPEEGSLPQYPSAIEAAREELSALSMIGAVPAPKVTRTVLLCFVDEKGNQKEKLTIGASTSAGSKDELTCWILTLGTNKIRSLYNLPVSSDTMKVSWDRVPTDSLTIAFTYRTADGYTSIPGYLLP